MNLPLAHHSNTRIAIIGCGTAGLATASFLQPMGFSVEMFEQFAKPQPLGAGLLLQPSGLAVMQALGLGQQVIDRGGRVDRLYGETVNGRMVLDLPYADLDPALFGTGIHRGTLFSLLYQKALDSGVSITPDCVITDSRLDHDKRIIITDDGREFGPFDLVIDASGRRSRLRRHGTIKLDRQYPYSALWGMLDDPDQAFGKKLLQQRYDGARIMTGMMATGYAPDDPVKKCTFFWSLPPGGYERWAARDLDVWKEEVIRVWPEIAPMLAQFTRHDQLTHAAYSDIIMPHWHEDRLVFIGCAGHNTSPQLGQGANLALMDALVLAASLHQDLSINDAIAAFSQSRRNHIRFYQAASRLLTPFFQSDSRLASWLRDAFLGYCCKMPVMKQQILRTLAGIKTGPFSSLSLQDVQGLADQTGRPKLSGDSPSTSAMISR